MIDAAQGSKKVLVGGTRRLLRAEAAAGVRHHVGVSIVGIDRVGGPYYKLKLEQEAAIEALARRWFRAKDFLYLGRGINYPIALEGALKLKEISYIHAEGYPAGEMKHGPIALIEEDLPVVVLAADDGLFEKVVGNIQEAKARGGRIIAITNQSMVSALQQVLTKDRDVILPVPDAHPLMLPVLFTIPVQLLAYHVAVRRGCDVDQPRNLAKSVTVE